ncbi:hypothetical protein H8L32_17015 [Undibacterium sp. CY18W]|uniref:Uracil DNA glycosylase superfamily protein n=1 Tax=Undibacterium hunanense TaxID=2762292 RepID=A0ABR6ZTI3_9BURK|nr:hypothetical protein [Undibacterium hunanense]MBC3919196.1 hypothetical protein [Undibacterium hunanense]
MTKIQQQFESIINELTRPLNGQYPRPWMSDATDPLSVPLFIVGKNQAKAYPTNRLTHQRHMDALFNRAGESCRTLYDEMSGAVPSPTRKNINRFRAMLEKEGINDVLETNVICYSTPMSSDLALSGHQGGAKHGTEIFEVLLRFIQPTVLIVHGAGTAKQLSQILNINLPAPPGKTSEPVAINASRMRIFVVPSLALPAWNKWSSWSDDYLKQVAKMAADVLRA